jgi:hypothetical protein
MAERLLAFCISTAKGRVSRTNPDQTPFHASSSCLLAGGRERDLCQLLIYKRSVSSSLKPELTFKEPGNFSVYNLHRTIQVNSSRQEAQRRNSIYLVSQIHIHTVPFANQHGRRRPYNVGYCCGAMAKKNDPGSQRDGLAWEQLKLDDISSA